MSSWAQTKEERGCTRGHKQKKKEAMQYWCAKKQGQWRKFEAMTIKKREATKKGKNK